MEAKCGSSLGALASPCASIASQSNACFMSKIVESMYTYDIYLNFNSID